MFESAGGNEEEGTSTWVWQVGMDLHSKKAAF